MVTVFNCLRNWKTVPKQVWHFTVPPAVYEGSDFFASSPTLVYYWACWFLHIHFLLCFLQPTKCISEHNFGDGRWFLLLSLSLPFVLFSMWQEPETEDRKWGSAFSWITSYKETFSSSLSQLCLHLFSSGSLMSVYVYSFIYSPMMFQALHQRLGMHKRIKINKSFCTSGAYILLGGTDK